MKDKVRADKKIIKSSRVTQDTLNSLSESDLVKACPKPTNSPAYYRMAGRPANAQVTPASVYEGRCRECHEPGSRHGFIDFQHLTLDRIDEMLDRMESTEPSERMPANQAWGADEKKILVDYLKGKRSQLTGGN
jgi:hypothetical protein